MNNNDAIYANYKAFDLHFVDLVFRAKRDIRSLPLFHGARWSACLRFACAEINKELKDIIFAILPFRSGKNHIKKFEQLRLRLIMPDAGIAILPELIQALNTQKEEQKERGEFLPETLEVEFVQDAITGQISSLQYLPATSFAKFSYAAVNKEIVIFKTCLTWHINFITPLHMVLPPYKNRPREGRDKYCQADFFTSWQDPISHLLLRTRFLPEESPKDSGIKVIKQNLSSQALRYSKIYDGLVGEITCSGFPQPDLAKALVLGQYLGSGKNPAFGLGFWRIPELDSIRKIALP